MKKFCNCGSIIYVEFKWNGLRYIPIFYDETYNKIWECPGCGESVTAWVAYNGERILIVNLKDEFDN